MPLLLAVGCYALALLQRPGWAVSDTKIDLHVDPVRFLADVGVAVVERHLARARPERPVRRLPVADGAVLRAPARARPVAVGRPAAVAGDAAARSPRGAWSGCSTRWLRRDGRGSLHVVAAAAFVAEPVRRHVHEPRQRHAARLRRAAVAAADRAPRAARPAAWIVAGGVRADRHVVRGRRSTRRSPRGCSSGPLLLLLYEPALRLASLARGRGRSRGARRSLGAIASLWWVVPLRGRSRSTALTSCPTPSSRARSGARRACRESLRLMGYWLSYLGRRLRRRAAPVLRATPGRCSSGAPVDRRLAARARRSRSAASRGRAAGATRRSSWPDARRRAGDDRRLPRGHAAAQRHERSPTTTARLAAVPAHDLQGGAAAGARARGARRDGGAPGVAVAWRRRGWQGWARRRARRRHRGRAGVLGAGRSSAAARSSDQLTWKAIPSAWQDVARDLDRRPRRRPPGDGAARPAVQLLHVGRHDRPDPADPLATSPSPCARSCRSPTCAPSTCSGRPTRWSASAAACPASCGPLLDLQSVGSVVTGTDDDRDRSGALDANAAARELARSGLRPPDAGYGPRRTQPRAGRRGGGAAAPAAGAPRTTRRTPSPLVRLLPRDRADRRRRLRRRGRRPRGVRGAAARRAAALRRGPDGATQLRTLARDGSRIVITDSNRRRVFVPSQLRANPGATLAPDDPISEDGHQLNPWPRARRPTRRPSRG